MLCRTLIYQTMSFSCWLRGNKMPWCERAMWQGTESSLQELSGYLPDSRKMVPQYYSHEELNSLNNYFWEPQKRTQRGCAWTPDLLDVVIVNSYTLWYFKVKEGILATRRVIFKSVLSNTLKERRTKENRFSREETQFKSEIGRV